MLEAVLQSLSARRRIREEQGGDARTKHNEVTRSR